MREFLTDSVSSVSSAAFALRLAAICRSLVLLVLLSFLIVVPAKADPANFQAFTQRDGLASDYVASIAFGTNGAMWIGSPRGATFVQDKYWVTYTSEHGLGNSSIAGVATTSDGRTYLATNGGGLTLFDSTRKTYTLSNSAIPSNYLTSIAVDKRNRVWVGTFGAGVGRLDGETWTRLSLGNNYVSALALDASGNPWVATNDGAFFFDGQTWTRFTQALGLASNHVYAVAVGPDGRIWFGTDNGVTVYDGRRYRTYKQADGLGDNWVRAIAIDPQSRAWIGTQRGLSLLEGGANAWQTFTRGDGLPGDEITALAVDPRGIVWVGTSKGLATASTTTLSRVTAPPVVLVHGWHGPESDRIEDSEFRFLKKYMQEDGIEPFYAAGISPTRTLFQNAETLRDVIADVKTKTGAPRVDIIAFSMGGLNTRAYLESTLYQNDVRRAIILGTPQAGVRMWYPLLTREIEDRPNEPSTIELTPEYADLFNRTHTPRATVPYDLLVGDARSQSGLDLLKQFPPGDGLIDEWSAHALNGPLVRHIVNSDVHAWNPTPLPFNITSYLYPEQTYDRFLRNALRDPDTRPIGFAAVPVPATAPRNTTPMFADTLRASDTATRTVEIDAARTVRFVTRWTSGDVSLNLRAPDGTRYSSNDFHQATYLKADIGSFIAYSIPRAQAGTWTLTVNRTDKGKDPITVTTYADLDSDLRLSIGTDRAAYPLGASPVISATLSNRTAGVDISARVEWLGDGKSPRGNPTLVKLIAEGEPGNFAEILTGLNRPGYYLARVTARGQGFARERQILFSISPHNAQLMPGARVRTDGAAGNYKSLVAEAPVSVTRAGAFAVAATLRDKSGQVILSLTAPVTFATGSQTATVVIPGRDLRARGIDGPYTIDLNLMDISWAAVQVDEVLKAVTTDAFRSSEFGE